MQVSPLDTSHISRTMQSKIELGIEQLKNDVLNLIGLEQSSQDTVRRLEKELNVYKLALENLHQENARLQRLHDETTKAHALLKDSVKGHRVIALLDGDGAIFSSELISQGLQGGHQAARMLLDSIMQYLTANCGAGPFQLWVYLFYNKRGLTDALGRAGVGFLNKNFEDFIVGFNQATERFIMVDVGNTKEAADVKIKVHLEDDIRLPQTCKIVFGGCHDNGYVSTLHSQITAGFREKLILLKGYTQMAPAIAALNLPALEIPDLFMTEKLGSGSRWMPASNSPNQIVVDTSSTLDESSKMLSGKASDEVDAVDSSYSRVLQRAAPPNLRERSTRERSPSAEASWEGPGTGTRRVNPNFVEPFLFLLPHYRPNLDLIGGPSVSRNKPPPCTLFYLSNCKHGLSCKYAHDYLLNDEHFQELRENARLAPCPAINRDELCTWGDACCYGHVCPHSTKCPFFKQGKCKFRGSDMHRRDPAGVLA